MSLNANIGGLVKQPNFRDILRQHRNRIRILEAKGGAGIPCLAAEPSNPFEGFIFFDTTDTTIRIYCGGIWWKSAPLIPVAPGPYSFEVLLDTPIMYLRMEELAGTLCADSSGNGHDGTITGSASRGFAMGLAGIDVGTNLTGGYISVPDDPVFDYTADFTVEFWLRASSLPGFASVLFSGGYTGANGGPRIYLDPGGTIFMTNAFAGGNYGSFGGFATGTIYHFVITWDSVGGVSNIYVNGFPAASGSHLNQFANNSEDIGIGNDFTNGVSSGLTLNGVMDEVAFYDYQLTGARILAHWNSRATP